MGAGLTDRASALINAEIDGTLAGPERAELNRLLLADPAVRALRDELRRTCQELDAVEPEEIPADLHESIMAALPVTAVRCDEPATPGRFGRPVLRYAAVFAAGLLVSALAFQFAGVGSPEIGPQDLAGTLAPVEATTLQIDLPQVQGQVALAGSVAAPVVVTRLAATSPVAVVATLEGREVRLDGFVASQETPIERSAGLGVAQSTDPVVVEIRVVDAVSGAVLYRAALRPNVAN